MQDLTLFIANHPILLGAFGIVILLILIVEALRTKQNVYALSPQKAVQLINHENAQIIDIRSVDHFRKGHIIEAMNIPLAELKTNSKKLEKIRSRPIILVCSTGVESQKLASAWLKRGYTIYTISGGIRAWMNDQLPIVKEQSK